MKFKTNQKIFISGFPPFVSCGIQLLIVQSCGKISTYLVRISNRSVKSIGTSDGC